MRSLWCYEERPLEEAELAAKVKGWAKLSQGQKDGMMEPATLEVQAENCVKKVGQLMKQSARALDVLKKEAAKKQVRRSMHQDCLLNPRNFVSYPFFTHFPPFFAHFLRLDARNPENTARSPGENGKKSEKIAENGGN